MFVLKGLMQILQFECRPKEGPCVGPSQTWQESKGFASKLLPGMPLNSQDETEI